jgi:hypothetical protein
MIHVASIVINCNCNCMQAPPSHSDLPSLSASSSNPLKHSSPDLASPLSGSAEKGVTFRVVVLCLALAAFFGYIIPVLDYKFANTYLGGTHLAPGALATLLILLLVVNPLLRLLRSSWGFSA